VICPDCQGNIALVPRCATCGGSGVVYCCEGSGEQDVLAKYSTPGLKRGTLTRSAKKAQLEALRYAPADIAKTLDQLYPQER